MHGGSHFIAFPMILCLEKITRFNVKLTTLDCNNVSRDFFFFFFVIALMMPYALL